MRLSRVCRGSHEHGNPARVPVDSVVVGWLAVWKKLSKRLY